MSELKKTPLHAEHLSLKARMVPFGGWDMPVQYAGVIPEHLCVRNEVGLFDVSHMGEFIISGEKALDFLQRVTTNDASVLTDGRCQYTLMCYENGTVVDDLIVSRLGENQYLAVVNASNIEKDFAWMNENNKEGVTLENISNEKSLLAVQGPKSEALMNSLFEHDFSDLKYYHFTTLKWKNETLFISRTGYTGEDGFEIMVSNANAAELWRGILETGQKHGVKPIGLGARDTLRLEASYSLYGHEISDEIDALSACLGWVVKLKKDDFIGKAALAKIKEEGAPKKIVGVELKDPGVAREGYKLMSDGQEIGYITSGTHSPLLKKPIALALINKDCSEVGKEVEIDIRGKRKKAVIVNKPFYKKN